MDYFSASNLHKLDQLLRILIFLRIILLHPIEELAIIVAQIHMDTSDLYFFSSFFYAAADTCEDSCPSLQP